MAVWMVGSAVHPIAFAGQCEERGIVPPGITEPEERLVCARLHCQKGCEHSGNDCMLCERYRGWRDGPGASEIRVMCAWSSEMPIWQRMTCNAALVTVPPQLSVGEGIEIATENKLHHLLVTKDGELIGVVCRCDLSSHRFDDPVTTCLRRDVLAIAPSATLGEAAGAMAQFGVSCLPVIEDGQLVGVITHSDLRSIGGPPRPEPCFDCGEID